MAEVKVKPEVPDPMDIESRCCGRPEAGVEAAGRRGGCVEAGREARDVFWGGALSFKA